MHMQRPVASWPLWDIVAMFGLLISYIWGWGSDSSGAFCLCVILYFSIGVASHLRSGEGPADLGQSPPHPGGHGVAPLGARQRYRGRAWAGLTKVESQARAVQSGQAGRHCPLQRFALALPRVAPPRPRSDTPFSVRIRCTKP